MSYRCRWRNLTAGLVLASLAGAGVARASELIINTDTSYAGPKAAMEWAIDSFKTENPDVKVTWNIFDHEGYKTAIRNFLQADPPDILTWYSGHRMLPFVKAGAFMDVTDLWKKDGLDGQMASAMPSMTYKDKQWGIPYSYYQWGIYYNKAVFDRFGVTSPKTWQDFLDACARFKAGGVDCTTTGNKALWPAAAWFDYIDLRTNGYQFHMDLTAGKVSWTDPRVKKVFAEWAKMVKPGYFTTNTSALDWQDAAPLLVQGKAATYLMGNFAVDVFKKAGMKESDLGFFAFPTITPGLARAEDAPTESVHAAANAPNPETARKFLAYIATPKVQGRMNDIMGQLPVNSESKVGDDTFLRQGFGAVAVLRPGCTGRDGEGRHGGVPGIHRPSGA